MRITRRIGARALALSVLVAPVVARSQSDAPSAAPSTLVAEPAASSAPVASSAPASPVGSPAPGSVPPAASTAPASSSAPPASPAPGGSPAPTGVLGALVQLASHVVLTPTGYIETFYQWNFNQPGNGITNYRGFDNRHNSFTIANVVLDVAWAVESVSGRIALQVGHTPESYYLAEPTDRAAATGAGATGPNVWKYIQQANIAWRAPIGRGLLLEGGIFFSPVGPEGFAIKDQWNFSRSNLFFGLPFYHTGVRVTYPFTEALHVTLAGYNGWNSVVDNNDSKSIAATFSYNIPDRIYVAFTYFGGVERPPHSAEGDAWRHLFDGYAGWNPTRWLALSAQVDGGFEANQLGTAGWIAAAGYVRVHPIEWFYAAVRGDYFAEMIPNSPLATPIFWNGSHWVASFTGTLDVRPHPNVSFRVEYRHDASETPIFYRGAVAIDAMHGTYVGNAVAQDTVTFGAVAWF